MIKKTPPQNICSSVLERGLYQHGTGVNQVKFLLAIEKIQERFRVRSQFLVAIEFCSLSGIWESEALRLSISFRLL